MRWLCKTSQKMLTQYGIRMIRFGILLLFVQDSLGLLWNAFDISYWRCKLKRGNECPDSDIKIFLYTSEYPYRKRIDVRNPNSLRYAGWEPDHDNVIIIHGFNGTESKTPMTIIRDAYLRRGGYNVFTIDWEVLTFFPCYLSSLSNTRLVAQCSAQFYSFLTSQGATAETIQCVGHSLGAHICGMMSNHLTIKQHKIIGLDPARPLLHRFGSKALRLGREDAKIVQAIHTNAGFLGEMPEVGHIDICVNGGHLQPGCRGEPRRIREHRCSHFKSACFFAASIADKAHRFKAVPCSTTCRYLPFSSTLERSAIPIGHNAPEHARGTFCIRMDDSRPCPFD